MANNLSQARVSLIKAGDLVLDDHNSDLQIVDTRGANEYGASHIPRAINLPAVSLQDPNSPRGALKPAKELVQIVSQKALDPDRPVILYDDTGLVPSARVFWVLDQMGFGMLALLDGGLYEWEKTGQSLETSIDSQALGSSKVPPSRELTFTGEKTATKEEVLAALGDPKVAIVDARAQGEYLGQVDTANRNGHIPGAVNINWESHIHGLFDARFQSLEDLKALYASNGVTPDKEVFVYCRSGARSSHSYFVLRALGFKKVKNYAGSWLEWGNDPEVPVETHEH